MRKLTAAGYVVNVIYGTGGNIAVRHDDLLRIIGDADLLKSVCAQSELANIAPAQIADVVRRDLVGWDRFHDPYTRETRFLSGMLRRMEAREAAMSCGVALENIHFLDLTFYDSGKVRKRPLSEEDVNKALTLVRRLKAGIDIAAGDVTDPNGTHRVVLEAARRAWHMYDAERQDDLLPRRRTYLYRVAWATWALHNIDFALTLSSKELEDAILAASHHRSQIPLRFDGGDPRSILERARCVRTTQAEQLKMLGLCDKQVAGVETLVAWDCNCDLSLIF
jgi:glucosamine-6-phosphate deaminase